jgi:hypothetical protein
MTSVGKHSEEAAEARGVWFRWHDDSNVGIPEGFYQGGKCANDTTAGSIYERDIDGF